MPRVIVCTHNDPKRASVSNKGFSEAGMCLDCLEELKHEPCQMVNCEVPHTGWLVTEFMPGEGIVFPTCDRHRALLVLDGAAKPLGEVA